MTIGLIELLKSKKATLSLLILACATTALLMGKLEGIHYAGIISTIAVIYNYCQHKIDLATTQPPPRGQL